MNSSIRNREAQFTEPLATGAISAQSLRMPSHKFISKLGIRSVAAGAQEREEAAAGRRLKRPSGALCQSLDSFRHIEQWQCVVARSSELS
jgi:hypothetical protein